MLAKKRIKMRNVLIYSYFYVEIIAHEKPGFGETLVSINIS